jgi:hypothetical protein
MAAPIIAAKIVAKLATSKEGRKLVMFVVGGIIALMIIPAIIIIAVIAAVIGASVQSQAQNNLQGGGATCKQTIVASAQLISDANSASNSTGVSAADLLKVTCVETAWGRAQYAYPGAAEAVDYALHNGMPLMDSNKIAPGEKTAVELGLTDGRVLTNWTGGPISGGGVEQAIGFAQFLPTTWSGYAATALLGNLLDHTPDPYVPFDAMTLTGMYLNQLGIKTNEIKALCYYGGAKHAFDTTGTCDYYKQFQDPKLFTYTGGTGSVSALLTSLVHPDQATSAGLLIPSGPAFLPIFQNAPQPNGFPNAFPAGWCTWWAARNHQLPVGVNGDAGDWGAQAKQAGMVVSNTPTVGNIVSWPRASYPTYGHVGVVIAVSSNTYTVSEMNYTGFDQVDQRIVNFPDPKNPVFIQ